MDSGIIDWTLVITPQDKYEQLLQDKMEQLANDRWRAEIKPFYFASKDAYFDVERSQLKYIRALDKGITTMWKTIDGSWVQMSTQDFEDLISSYESYVEILFATEAYYQQQLLAAQTLDALEQVTWVF